MAETHKILMMRDLLMKHIELEKEMKQLLNKSLDRFANKIQSQYKSKLQFDKLQKAISDELCSISGKKDTYRKDIAKILSDNGTPNKLQNLYFYYCKFGKKDLGYSNNSTIKELFNEINNCIFLNVSFASTEFNRTKFKLVKFINASSGSKIYKQLMERSTKLKTIKYRFNKYDIFNFSNVSLYDSFFEDCEFYGIELSSLKNLYTSPDISNELLSRLFYQLLKF